MAAQLASRLIGRLVLFVIRISVVGGFVSLSVPVSPLAALLRLFGSSLCAPGMHEGGTLFDLLWVLDCSGIRGNLSHVCFGLSRDLLDSGPEGSGAVGDSVCSFSRGSTSNYCAARIRAIPLVRLVAIGRLSIAFYGVMPRLR